MAMNPGRSNTPKIKKLLIIVIIAVLAGLFGYFLANKNSNSSNTTSVDVPVVKVDPSGIEYPDGWQEQLEIPLADKQAGVVSEATRENPSARVIVREEAGELDEDFDISKLPAEVSSKLKEELFGFKLINEETTKLGQFDAVRINYTDSSDKTYTNAMFIVPTSQKAFYITYRTAEDLAKINGDIDKINQSIIDYIKTHL